MSRFYVYGIPVGVITRVMATVSPPVPPVSPSISPVACRASTTFRCESCDKQIGRGVIVPSSEYNHACACCDTLECVNNTTRIFAAYTNMYLVSTNHKIKLCAALMKRDPSAKVTYQNLLELRRKYTQKFNRINRIRKKRHLKPVYIIND